MADQDGQESALRMIQAAKEISVAARVAADALMKRGFCQSARNLEELGMWRGLGLEQYLESLESNFADHFREHAVESRALNRPQKWRSVQTKPQTAFLVQKETVKSKVASLPKQVTSKLYQLTSLGLRHMCSQCLSSTSVLRLQ